LRTLTLTIRIDRILPGRDIAVLNEAGRNDTGSGHAQDRARRPIAHILPDVGEPAEPPRIAPARDPPAWDAPPVDAAPDWEVLEQPSPEYVFDQQVQW
jgi:hypothetical protein